MFNFIFFWGGALLLISIYILIVKNISMKMHYREKYIFLYRFKELHQNRFKSRLILKCVVDLVTYDLPTFIEAKFKL